jgi:hypothetical protein
MTNYHRKNISFAVRAQGIELAPEVPGAFKASNLGTNQESQICVGLTSNNIEWRWQCPLTNYNMPKGTAQSPSPNDKAWSPL